MNRRSLLLLSGAIACQTLLGVVARAEGVWFAEPLVTSTTHQFDGVVVGDLNRDGRTDAVAVDEAADRTIIYLSGERSILTPVDSIQTAPYGRKSVTLLDANNDQFLDLTIPLFDHTQIWLNDGTAHFAPDLIFGGGTWGVATGDLDGDGFDDLVTTQWQGLLVYWGSSTGLLASAQSVLMVEEHTDQQAYVRPSIRDLNGDGIKDLIALGCFWPDPPPPIPTIRWCLGLGGRQFGPYQAYNSGGECTIREFDLADLDLDDDQDLLVWRYDLRLYTYDSSTNRYTWVATMPGGAPTLGRIDSDDYPDLCIASLETPGGSETWVYRGRGLEFEFVQSLVGPERCTLGSFVTAGVERDLIGVGHGGFGTPALAVWPTTLIPEGVSEDGLRMESHLAVQPTIASNRVRISLQGPFPRDTEIRVFDVTGRILRSIPAVTSDVMWDLTDQSGHRLSPGFYWISCRSAAGEEKRGKVLIVR